MKNQRQEKLVDRLHANGVRRRVAKQLVGARDGSTRSKAMADDLLHKLETATVVIRDDVLGGKRKRSEAARKAARTRKRNAEKRSTTAKRGARSRST